MNNYYVYIHLKETTGIPFYVGKGVGNRAYEFTGKNRNQYWKRIQRKHGVIVEFYKTDLTEKEALETEKFLINLYRITEIPLTNLTDGGEGVSGLRYNDKQLHNLHLAVKKAIGVEKIKSLPKRPSAFGVNNHFSDKNLYSFTRLSDGLLFVGTKSDLIEKFDLSRDQIKKLFYKNNPRRSANGWRLTNNGGLS